MVNSEAGYNAPILYSPQVYARQGRVIRSAGRSIIPTSVPANIDLPLEPRALSSSRRSASRHWIASVTGCVTALAASVCVLQEGDGYSKLSSSVLSFMAQHVEESSIVAVNADRKNASASSKKRPLATTKLTLIPPVKPRQDEPSAPSQLSGSQTFQLASFSVAPRASTSESAPTTAQHSAIERYAHSSAPLLGHRSAISRVYSIIRKYAPKNQDPHLLAETIVRESRRQGYDPLFVAAVIKSESTFNATARSNRGAQGLMQIMPATGSWIASRNDLPKGKLTDPGHNLQLGITYLKHLDGEFGGNKVFTLVAYNWGPGHVQKATGGKKRIPRECLTYALRILSDYKRWQSGTI